MSIYRIFIGILYLYGVFSATQKIRYIAIERPAVVYHNPAMIKHANSSAFRLSRADPVYYYNLYLNVLVYFGNNITVDFYFYEWLSNRYQRGFVEMHFLLCDLIHKDQFFGAAMKQGPLDRPCPYPPGEYNLVNMTVPTTQIPKSFPFTKGRIYANASHTFTKENVLHIYADMEIKEMKVKTKQ